MRVFSTRGWLLAGVFLLGSIATGAWYAYRAHVRGEVDRALAHAAERLGLDVVHEGVTVGFPDRVRIRGLKLRSTDGASGVRVARVDLRRPLRLGAGEQRSHVWLPEQPVQLWVHGRRWDAELRVSAVLAPAAGSVDEPVLREVFVTVRDLREQGPGGGPLASLVQVRAASEGPLASGRLRGRVYTLGPDVERPLALAGAASAMRWLFPEAKGQPFSAGASLRTSEGQLALTRISAYAGDVAVAGALRVTNGEVSGALLIEVPTRRVGIEVLAGQPRPELTPGPGWLERQLERGGLSRVGPRGQRASKPAALFAVQVRGVIEPRPRAFAQPISPSEGERT